MKNISQSLKVVFLAIVLSFGISYVFAWTAPTLAPTGGNSTAPLNTSNIDQTKNGNLFLNALGITNTALGALNVAGGAVFGSNGTMSPNALLTLYDGDVLLKQNVVTGNTGANNIGFAIDTGVSTGAAASMGIFKEAVNGASSLLFKNWNGLNTVETVRIASNGNLTATGVICDSTGCIGGATVSHGKQRFTSNGTFTVPAGVTKVWVSMSGGGGGGAAGVSGAAGGGGGGAHAVIASELSVISGVDITVTIGAGGAGGSFLLLNGGNGGVSSFGTFSTAGGAGGSGANGGNAGGSGGSMGGRRDFANDNGGDGGGSIFGAAGNRARNAGGYGAGGGGSDQGTGGGNGAPGFVLVEW